MLAEQLSLERGARHHVGTQVWHVLGATARSGICESDAQVQQTAHGPHITSLLEGDLHLCLLHLARNREQVSRGLSKLVHSWCDLIKWKGEQEVLSLSVCYNQSKNLRKSKSCFWNLHENWIIWQKSQLSFAYLRNTNRLFFILRATIFFPLLWCFQFLQKRATSNPNLCFTVSEFILLFSSFWISLFLHAPVCAPNVFFFSLVLLWANIFVHCINNQRYRKLIPIPALEMWLPCLGEVIEIDRGTDISVICLQDLWPLWPRPVLNLTLFGSQRGWRGRCWYREVAGGQLRVLSLQHWLIQSIEEGYFFFLLISFSTRSNIVNIKYILRWVVSVLVTFSIFLVRWLISQYLQMKKS